MKWSINLILLLVFTVSNQVFAKDDNVPKSHIIDIVKETFKEEPEIMLAIFKGESDLGEDPKYKEVDITKNGYVFSHGIAQINLTVHSVGGLDCPSAFDGENQSAVMVNEKLYKKCVQAAENPSLNMITARKIYDTQGKGAWGAYLTGKYLRHTKYARWLVSL